MILAGLGAFSARQLRFENDYRLLREDSDSDAFFEYVDDSLDMRFDPSVVFLDDVADLATARAIVERRRGVDTPRIDAVLGLDDFLPPRTDRRAAAIDTLRALLDEPMLTLADDPRLDEARALAAAEPWGVEDAPAWVRERFVARDGRGAVLLLYPDRRIQSDAAAVRWHTELEALRQELDAAGVRYAISSEALLPGWVYMAMRDEGPRLIGAEAAFVSLIVVVYFGWEARLRGVARAALVLVPLAAGVLWAAGAMAAMGAPLTMFTLFVFPCVVGIGVDDLVHLVHRHAHDGGSLRAIYRETGPAIVLTSLTTAAGFGAAVFARHPGIASVAPVAVLAVGSMLAAALVFVPALLAASSLGRPSCTPSERGPVEEPSRV